MGPERRLVRSAELSNGPPNSMAHAWQPPRPPKLLQKLSFVWKSLERLKLKGMTERHRSARLDFANTNAL
jgi:hypothetical protein